MGECPAGPCGEDSLAIETIKRDDKERSMNRPLHKSRKPLAALGSFVRPSNHVQDQPDTSDHRSTMPPSRNQLLDAASSFCRDFAEKKDPDVLLQHFSTMYKCTIIEHGQQSLAPFLGRTFVGLPAIRSYFTLISELLAYEGMRFSAYTVDIEARKVCVKGEATFTWLSTRESWDEAFIYMLDFDDELKVTDCQIWADSGAAYLAGTGRLNEIKKVMTNPI